MLSYMWRARAELDIINFQLGKLINTGVINSCKQDVEHTHYCSEARASYVLECVLIMEVSLPGECNESPVGPAELL